jgi:hypothetical protein
MNARAEAVDWLDANQRCLVAHFARLKALLAGEAAPPEPAPWDAPAPPAVQIIDRSFGLSPFERDLLLLAAGVEMDAALARACAEAQGRSDAAPVNFALALAALPGAHWSALAPAAPLRRWRLLEPADAGALTTGRLQIDERILHFLAGIDGQDERLRPLLQEVAAPSLLAEPHRRVAEELASAMESALDHGTPRCLQLVGSDAAGQRDVAATAALACGLQLQALCADDAPAAAADQQALALLLDREALLAPAAWLIEFGDATERPAALRLATRLRGLVLCTAREALVLPGDSPRWRVDRSDAREQRRLWRLALGDAAPVLAGTVDAIAGQFSLTAAHIAAAGARVARQGQAAPEAALWSACRTHSRPRLAELATPVEARAGWDDLVLPEAHKSQLRQLAAQVRHRLRVCEDWGFAGKSARGLGASALFAGESGTGKTMAAEVLARELHLELLRIDLSAVVSKYIGETEKNLRRVFDAAEEGGAVLLFDEADALFGKRSDVKDSHDRYANIEVSYLLQRMEAFNGLAILTTNMKGALDQAFQRRLRFVLSFPFPDQAQREAIWRSVLPAPLPREALDYGRLAQLHLAGGSIRNIALNAAFIAADRDEPLRMAHLLQAAHAEAGKRERPLAEAETRGWVA